MFQGFSSFLRAALLIALGGAAGALCRQGTYLAMHRSQVPLPWATLLVNLAGAFIIGYFFGAKWGDGGGFAEDMRLLVTVGFLGALTTFSTFSNETVQMMRTGQWGLVCANVLANNLGSFAMTLLGWRLGS